MLYTDEIISEIVQVIRKNRDQMIQDHYNDAQDIWDKLIELDVVKNFSERNVERETLSSAWSDVPIADVWLDSDANGLRDYVRKQWPHLANVLDAQGKSDET